MHIGLHRGQAVRHGVGEVDRAGVAADRHKFQLAVRRQAHFANRQAVVVGEGDRRAHGNGLAIHLGDGQGVAVAVGVVGQHVDDDGRVFRRGGQVVGGGRGFAQLGDVQGEGVGRGVEAASAVLNGESEAAIRRAALTGRGHEDQLAAADGRGRNDLAGGDRHAVQQQGAVGGQGVDAHRGRRGVAFHVGHLEIVQRHRVGHAFRRGAQHVGALGQVVHRGDGDGDGGRHRAVGAGGGVGGGEAAVEVGRRGEGQRAIGVQRDRALRQDDRRVFGDGLAAHRGDGVGATGVIDPRVEGEGRVFRQRDRVWRGGQQVLCQGFDVLDLTGHRAGELAKIEAGRRHAFLNAVHPQARAQGVVTTRGIHTGGGRRIRVGLVDVGDDAVDLGRCLARAFNLHDAVLGGQHDLTLLDHIAHLQRLDFAFQGAHQGAAPDAQHLAGRQARRRVALGNGCLNGGIASSLGGCRHTDRTGGRAQGSGGGSGRRSGGGASGHAISPDGINGLARA